MSDVVREFDVVLPSGATLHAYDAGAPTDDALAVIWHHGTPNIGAPPVPLFDAAQRLGLRWVSYDRPGYGGSSPAPGRDIASAAELSARVADALGIQRFAVMGHSGGTPHALACAALLPERVVAVVGVAGLAPFAAPDLDWFAGMSAGGRAALQAAATGRAAKIAYEIAPHDDDPGFTPADESALAGEWSWFLTVVGPAIAGGPDGHVDDDLAYVAPWGCDPAAVAAPTLLLHGARDRIAPSAHSAWLRAQIPTAELRVVPDAGHISVLAGADDALAWLRAHADRDPDI
jgi:pimeloyl-ACP methyl ester carboxylesterase